MNKHTDTRFIKTQVLIDKSFIELMEDIGFSKITVKKIIEVAQINRSTFYSHYLDKFDLLDKIEDNLLMGLNKIALNDYIENLPSSNFNGDAFNLHIHHIVNYMYQNGKLFALLMSEKGNPGFINKFISTSKEFWAKKNINEYLSLPQDYVFAALTGMMSNLFVEWIKKDFSETPDEFSRIIITIAKNIPQNIFNKENDINPKEITKI